MTLNLNRLYKVWIKPFKILLKLKDTYLVWEIQKVTKALYLLVCIINYDPISGLNS